MAISMRQVAGLVIVAGWAACMSPGTVDNPFICTTNCPPDGGTGGNTGTGGSAGTGGGSIGSGGGTTGTGGNATGGGAVGTGGGSAGTGGGAACTPDWQCAPWQLNSQSQAVRACTDYNNCNVAGPSQGPLPLPNLDLQYYKCHVQPTVDRGCSMFGCHGTAPNDPVVRPYRVFARGRLRNDESVPQVSTCLGGGMVNLKQEGSGTVMCVGWSKLTTTEWQKNFDAARLFAVGLASTSDSELLRQPLEGSGLAHANAKLFKNTSDPQYVKLKAWLDGAQGGACDAGSNQWTPP